MLHALTRRETSLLIAAALMLGAIGSPLAAEKLKVAVLTPGLTNDGSFNQAAADAVKKLAAEGLITVEVREKLADPAASEPVIRQYAAKGYDLIIGHGIELSEPILKVAAEFPKTHFAASGGPDLAGKLTANVDGWTYDFGQQGYLGGFVAGKLKSGNVIGIVGGPQRERRRAPITLNQLVSGDPRRGGMQIIKAHLSVAKCTDRRHALRDQCIQDRTNLRG
jgi:basic membrane protein A and related proteins